MPTYEYDCPRCGTFTALKPLAQYREAQNCPHCSTPAPRVTLSVPALGGMFTAARTAGEPRSLQSCFHGAGGGCRCC